MTGEHGEGVRVFGRLWHGRVGKTKPFACFVVVVFFFRRRSVCFCLPYSAHAIGFRLSLPLLTFSISDLHDCSVCFIYASAGIYIYIYTYMLMSLSWLIIELY
jgi:hypothetical protein